MLIRHSVQLPAHVTSRSCRDDFIVVVARGRSLSEPSLCERRIDRRGESVGCAQEDRVWGLKAGSFDALAYCRLLKRRSSTVLQSSEVKAASA
jgi:hypothetical protein